MIDTATPEELEVLRLIAADGIEANLTDEQKQIRDRLEARDLIYLMGDEYDANFYLTAEGKEELAMTDPARWPAEYERLKREVQRAKACAQRIPGEVADRIAHLQKRTRELQQAMQLEMESAAGWLARATAEAERLERELKEWVEANKDKLTRESPDANNG